jgi:hypothetical protein
MRSFTANSPQVNAMTPKTYRIVLSYLLAFLFLSPLPASARKKIVTLASSGYGSAGGQAQWLLQGKSNVTVNGVNVSTETICPAPDGGIDTAHNPPVCSSANVGNGLGRYVFLYQIPTPPSNLVLTFSGLAGFAFDASTLSPAFGVILCGSNGVANNMLCTQTDDAGVQALNIGFDAIGGNLVLTVPPVPSGLTLTFFISENLPSFPDDLAVPLPAPKISIGGAIVSPPALAFGSQEASATSSPQPQTVTLTNSPDYSPNLTLASITPSTGFTSIGDCDSTSSIAPGKSCAFTLAFNPASAASPPGTATAGTFIVADNSPQANELANLSGIATSAGVTIFPSALVFGSQLLGTSSSSQTVVISNSATGPNPLKFTFATLQNPETGLADFAEQNNCGGSVAPGTNCQVAISFTPSFSGSLSTTWIITDNSPDKTHAIQLSGTGIDANTVDTTASTLDFGSQLSGTPSTSKTVAFNNVHAVPLSIVAVNPTAEFSVTANNCPVPPSTLPAGNGCSVSVSFNPTLGGPLNGTLTIATDAVDGSLVVPLAGTGMDFALSAASTSTSVPRGTPASYNLSLTPEGGFTGVVQVTCTGAPSEAVCTPNPASPNLNGANAAPISIGITTKAPIVCGLLPPGRIYPPKNLPLPFGTLLLTFCLALLILKIIRKTQSSHSWLAAAVIIIVLTCVSCGSSTQVTCNTQDPGTPTGHATITVTAINGNLQHSITLDLNVTP